MRNYLVFLTIGLLSLGTYGLTWPVCPEQPNDNGICDSLYVEIYSQDRWIEPTPSPYDFVRFPILVTHDVPNPVDSIAAFVLAFCYTLTNADKYCSLSSYWNTISLHDPNAGRSIFRHFIEGPDTVIHNWMMDLYEEGNGEEWNGLILDLDGISHFWFTAIPSGSEDKRFGSGSRILLATMTFKLEDSTTIAIDTCMWPPGRANVFSRSDAVTYIPRLNMPHGISVLRSIWGDANGDQEINIIDVIYMMNYLFRYGPPPVTFEAGDANCDDDHGILDVVYLINYLYKNGPVPHCP